MCFLRLRPETAPLNPPGAAPTLMTVFHEAEPRKSAAIASALSIGQASSSSSSSTSSSAAARSTRRISTAAAPAAVAGTSTKMTPSNSLPKSCLESMPEMPEEGMVFVEEEMGVVGGMHQQQVERERVGEGKGMGMAVLEMVTGGYAVGGSNSSGGGSGSSSAQTARTEAEKKRTAGIAASLALEDSGGVETVLDGDRVEGMEVGHGRRIEEGVSGEGMGVEKTMAEEAGWRRKREREGTL